MNEVKSEIAPDTWRLANIISLLLSNSTPDNVD